MKSTVIGDVVYVVDDDCSIYSGKIQDLLELGRVFEDGSWDGSNYHLNRVLAAAYSIAYSHDDDDNSTTKKIKARLVQFIRKQDFESIISAAKGDFFGNTDCPFCGSVNLSIGHSTPDREGTPMHVYCDDCGAQGPWAYLNEHNTDLLSSLEYMKKKTGWDKRALAVPKKGGVKKEDL